MVPSGESTVLMAPGSNTMVFGIDTSHPAPGSNFPTMAAMVFSIDQKAVVYRSFIKFQPPRQEVVMGLREMTLVRKFNQVIESIDL
jgi:hypothetical protein